MRTRLDHRRRSLGPGLVGDDAGEGQRVGLGPRLGFPGGFGWQRLGDRWLCDLRFGRRGLGLVLVVEEVRLTHVVR
jgi:hypothetical protein